MTQVIDRSLDLELKERHRRMWASGDYGAVAREVIPALGQELVAACRIGPDQRVLDVAAGTGNAAIPAARTGATVVASDLVPELLDEGRKVAEAEGVHLTWEPGDVEDLPYEDASFDTVISCVGAMFAPNHPRTADELVRVVRPGGTVALISWTPAGFIGRMFAAMRPYMPAPPPGAQPPPLWGVREHLDELFGDRVVDARYEVRTLRVTRFATAGAFRDFFRDMYGPTIGAYRNVGDDLERRAGLDAALIDLAEDALHDGEMDWEYLLYTSRRVR
jgi:SAM-dependent methyltransferase